MGGATGGQGRPRPPTTDANAGCGCLPAPCHHQPHPVASMPTSGHNSRGKGGLAGVEIEIGIKL